MKPIENISQEIEDLREQLLSLDEEIWGSVEHRDTNALRTFLPLKEKINERIKAFQNAANELLSLHRIRLILAIAPPASGHRGGCESVLCP